jgi:hypothetical protein
MFKHKLGTITLLLNSVETIIDADEDLRIEENDLVTEFAEQPSKFAFYGGIYSDAIIELERKKRATQEYEAELEPKIRAKVHAALLPGERITEAKIDAEYKRDEKWQELFEAVLNFEAIVRKLETWKNAFNQRAQMLYILGRTKQQEMMRIGNISEND